MPSGAGAWATSTRSRSATPTSSCRCPRTPGADGRPRRVCRRRNYKQGDFSLGAINYYSDDIINIFYTEAKLRDPAVGGHCKLQFAAQYSDQQSTGDELLTGSDFSASQCGAQGRTGRGRRPVHAWPGPAPTTTPTAESLERLPGLHQRAGRGLQPRRRRRLDAARGIQFQIGPGPERLCACGSTASIRTTRRNYAKDEYDFNLQWAAPAGTLQGPGAARPLRRGRPGRSGGPELQRPAPDRRLRCHRISDRDARPGGEPHGLVDRDAAEVPGAGGVLRARHRLLAGLDPAIAGLQLRRRDRLADRRHRASAWLFEVPVSAPAKSLVFLLFLFGIGYEVGPRFFSAMKGDGWRFAVLGVFVPVVGLLTAWAVARTLRARSRLLRRHDVRRADRVAGDGYRQRRPSPRSRSATTERQTTSPISASPMRLCYVFGALGVILFCAERRAAPAGHRPARRKRSALEAKFGIAAQPRRRDLGLAARIESRAYRRRRGRRRRRRARSARPSDLVPERAPVRAAHAARRRDRRGRRPDLRIEAGRRGGRGRPPRSAGRARRASAREEVDDRELLDIPLATFEVFV